MRTDTEGLLHILTTLGTFLRGVVRCNSNYLSTSTFSLVFEKLPQHPPRCIGYSKCQTMVPDHVGRMEVFYHDRLVTINVASRGFMEGVFSLISNPLMMTRNLVFRFLTPTAPFATFSKSSLGMSKLASAFLGMLRVVSDIPIAISYQVADTHIKTNCILFLGQELLFHITNALEIPARRAQDNAGKLESAFQGTVDNSADTTAAKPGSNKIATVQIVNLVSKLDGIPGLRIFKTRKTNFPTFFDPAKEVGKRAVKTFESRINNNSRQVGMFFTPMLFILLVEMHMPACFFVVRNQFLKAGIVHLARGDQHTHQCLLLLFVWPKSVLKRFHGLIIAQPDYIVNSLTRAKANEKPAYPHGLKPRRLAAGSISVIRPIIALLYLEQHEELPPTNFLETLREVDLSSDTRNAILELVEKKRAGFELGMDRPIPILNTFAEDHLNKWMQHGPEKQGERRDFRELDDIVLAILEGRQTI